MPHQQGLSPRVRGNRSTMMPSMGIRGSIPACAGEPSGGKPAAIFVAVYPRVCGGTSTVNRSKLSVGGLSPRVRGTH